MLHAALEAMVVDAMPSADQVEAIGADLPPAPGSTWNGYIARRDSGERVPCKVIAAKNWNGDVVIWAHPNGVASLSDNGQVKPDVQKLLDSGSTVLAIDMFMSGDFAATAPLHESKNASTKPTTAPYAGLRLGYQRSVIANRVHDLLSAIVIARGWKQTQSVRLIGFGRAGPGALLADALAGSAVSAGAIDLDGFDFDQVHDVDDPMLLPGGLKYGGLMGLSELCAGQPILLCNAGPGISGPGIKTHAAAEDLVQWLQSNPSAASNGINRPPKG